MTSPGRTLTCPACARPLREVVHRDVHVDACDCGGMWFDAGEIEAWTRQKDPVAVGELVMAPAEPDAPKCPRCPGEPMRRGLVRSVPFAQCGKCAGVWLPVEAVAKFDPAVEKSGRPGPLLSVFEFVAAVFAHL